MYNVLYDDENHGLELAKWKREHTELLNRARGLCRRVGITVDIDQLNNLTINQLRIVVGTVLDLLTAKLKEETDSWAPEERRQRYAAMVKSRSRRAKQ